MEINIGDVALNLEAAAEVNVQNANFKFDNFLSITSTFNPVTFGAGLLMDIWAADVARQRHEEQVALLQAIGEKLDRLNQTAEKILKSLDALPERLGKVFEAELLKDDLRENWNALEAVRWQFQTVPDYEISTEQWDLVTRAFAFVAQYEYRASMLAALPRSAELLNLLSAGTYQQYVSTFIDMARTRVQSYQEQLANQMVKLTAAFLSAAIDGPTLAFDRQYVHTFLRVVSDHATVTDLRNVTITVRVESAYAYQPMPGIHAHYPRWQEEMNRQPILQADIDARKQSFVSSYNELLDAFNNYNALSKPLAAIATYDFRTALESAVNRIAN
jgi:hypothetical protein